MTDRSLEEILLESAEAVDRKLGSGRIRLLKRSYAHFQSSGMDDAAIQKIMALTSHEMRLIKKER